MATFKKKFPKIMAKGHRINSEQLFNFSAKDMSNCCQDTPILYGNTQRQMRGVFPCNFGWGTRFRAQNEDFVHF